MKEVTSLHASGGMVKTQSGTNATSLKGRTPMWTATEVTKTAVATDLEAEGSR